MRTRTINWLGLLVGLSLAFPAWAQIAPAGSEPIPETDLGRVVIAIDAAEPARAWIARAHEDHIRNMLSESPRLSTLSRGSVKLASCEASNFVCKRKILRAASVDLFVEGTLEAHTLHLRSIIPETEIELSDISIDVSEGTSPEQVKSQVLHVLKPFVEAGGILDQKSILRRAEKAAATEEGPQFAKRAFGIVLALMSALVLLVVIAALMAFPNGRRPLLKLGLLWIFFVLAPLWLISEDLALIKPVAIFALPEPWILAVTSGLGFGWALWALGLCILPQLRGLESLKQNRMRLLVDALSTVIIYRALAFLVWLAIAIATIVTARIVFNLNDVHTAALGLVVIGGLATVTALVFEVLAQALDRRFVSGEAQATNLWHIRVEQALRHHPLLADLRDVLAATLVLPTTHERPLAYGGGMSRPRILIPEEALKKAFATPPEEGGAPYDFLAGLVLDGLARVCLRSHLDTTLRWRSAWRGETIAISGQSFLLAPYRQARQLLEGGFVMVHEGLGPLIQYLYWAYHPESTYLTIGAGEGQYTEVTRRILGKVPLGMDAQSLDQPRDRICWLVRNFRPTQQEHLAVMVAPRFRFKSRWTLVVLTLVSFLSYQSFCAYSYHDVYTERIAAQQAKIDEMKKKKEAPAYVQEAEPGPVVEPGTDTVEPPVPAKRRALVAKVSQAKAKHKKHGARTKSKPKPKPKPKQKQRTKKSR